MKQFIMLLIVTAIIVVIGLWEINYLDDSSQFILSDIDYSKNAINNGDFKTAKDHINQIENTWNDINPVWNVFIDHSEIDSIEAAMSMYKSYIDQQDKEQALVYANELDKYFRHIVDNEKISFDNVF